MAYYEYQCEECKKVFTVSERISEHEKHLKHECPHCSCDRTRQLISGFFAKTSSKT